MTDEDWCKVIAVNLSGTFFTSQAVLSHMIDRGSGPDREHLLGHRRDRQHRPGQLCRLEVGLFGLTKTLAREACYQLAKTGKLTEDSIGVTVNTVAPGLIATEMLEHVPEKVLDKIKAQIPVGRLGRADEVARVVHFLVSDYSSFITGQVINVNGGQEM